MLFLQLYSSSKTDSCAWIRFCSCGYNQEVPASTPAPFTDGILGLGNGKSSVLSQLSSLGLIRNVVGHCLSGQGGGFLFFGDDVLPSSGIVWTPILRASSEYVLSVVGFCIWKI